VYVRARGWGCGSLTEMAVFKAGASLFIDD
jgi:hypothetical protein